MEVRCDKCANAKITDPYGDLKCTIKNHEAVLDFFMKNLYTYCGEYSKGAPQYTKDEDE